MNSYIVEEYKVMQKKLSYVKWTSQLETNKYLIWAH